MRTILLTAILIICSTSLGLAEDQANGSNEKSDQKRYLNLSLEELMQVEVSVASPFEESELVLGSVVEKIDIDRMERIGARNVKDALSFSPSTMAYNSLFGGAGVVIRGFAVGSFSSDTATILDGIPVNLLVHNSLLTEQFGLQLGTLDSIELIRGPASALHGADAFQGVISLKTFEAEEDTVETDAEYGSDKYFRSSLRASQGIGEHLRWNTAIGFSDQADQNEGYSYSDLTSGEPLRGERDFEHNSFNIISKLRGENEGSFASELGFYFFDTEQEGFPGLGTSQFQGQSRLQDRDLSTGDSRFVMGRSSTTIELPSQMEVNVDGFYFNAKLNRFVDRSRIPPNISVGGDNDSERYGVNTSIKQRLRLLNTGWQFGYQYNDNTVYRHNLKRFNADGDLIASVPGSQTGISRDVHSAIFQARTEFFDASWHMLYGGRLDEFSDIGSQATPLLGIIYQPDQSSALKVLYGSGYRSPSSAEIGGTPAVEGNSNLDPVSIDTWQFVALKTWRNMRTALTFFYSEQYDGIAVLARDDDTNFTGQFANQNRASARGVEAELNLLENDFRADFSSSWVDTESDSDNLDYGAFPDWIVNFGGGYTYAPWNLEIYLNNRIHLGANEGSAIPTIPNPSPLKDYWRSDLYLNWQASEKMDVYVNVLNVFDRDNCIPSLYNAEDGIPDPGITAFAGIRFRL